MDMPLLLITGQVEFLWPLQLLLYLAMEHHLDLLFTVSILMELRGIHHLRQKRREIVLKKQITFTVLLT